RLRRHVDHDVGRELLHALRERGKVAHVAHAALHPLLHARQRKETGLRGRLQRIAAHARAQRIQEHAQPASLEARVARDKDALAAPELRIHVAPLSRNSSLRQWKASANPLPERLSMPRRRIMACRLSALNQGLPACEANEVMITSTFIAATSLDKGT